MTPEALADRVLADPPRCGTIRLVCIDGPAGSGKTTLAAALAAAVRRRGRSVEVVHLDDLTLTATAQIKGNGYRLFVKGTAAIGASAAVHNDGTAGSGQPAVAASANGTLFGSPASGARPTWSPRRYESEA